MSSRQLNVLVIGGGVGGLCLAQGLRKAGVRVAVYERDRNPDARLQGYRLNIEPVGSRALRECLPADLWDILVATAGDPGPGMGVLDESLRELVIEPGQPAGDPANGTHAVSRTTLRNILLAGLPEVHFDKEFVGYEQTGTGGVVAHFGDGSSAVGDLLVGADGARSRVRRQLLPLAGTVDLPAIGIGGKLPLNRESIAWLPPTLATRKNMILPRRDFLFTAVFRRREKPEEILARFGQRLPESGLSVEELLRDTENRDYLMWAFVTHRDSLPDRSRDLCGGALQEVVAERVSGWSPHLRRLVAESDGGAVEQFQFSAAESVAPWTTTSVTLLGDAIHGMPPVGGLGGNTALRDAALLCRALAAANRRELPLLTAISQYESEMLNYGFAAVRETTRYLRLAISPSVILRRTARSFFRLCGTLPPLRRAVFSDA